jgi:hypothetical protein
LQLAFHEKQTVGTTLLIKSFFSQLKIKSLYFYPIIKITVFKNDLKSNIHYYKEKRIQYKLGFPAPPNYYSNYQKAI